MIHESDRLKNLEEILEPDTRVKLWQGDPQLHLSSLHRRLDEIKLELYVHVDVQKEFEKAKNIVLYSFYSYSMSSVAILHAYACIEKVIIQKAQKLNLITKDYNYRGKELLPTGAGLNRRINFALDRKWLGKKHFFLYDSNENEIPDNHFEQHLKWWVSFRNSLSHNPGFLDILWRVPEQLQVFANLINAIAKNNDPLNSEIPEIHLPKCVIHQCGLTLILMKRIDLLEFVPIKVR